jgi:hypothetical protein
MNMGLGALRGKTVRDWRQKKEGPKNQYLTMALQLQGIKFLPRPPISSLRHDGIELRIGKEKHGWCVRGFISLPVDLPVDH